MKINEILTEAESKNPIIQSLKGKKFTYDEMFTFLSKQNYLEQPHPNDHIFSIKKDAKIARNTLTNALNKCFTDGGECRPHRREEFDLGWNYESVPLDGKIQFDQTNDRDELHKQLKWAHDHSKGHAGGRGWWVDGRQMHTAVGVFLNGPLKDEPFASEFYGKELLKKNEKVKVKIGVRNGTLYGDVKITRP